MDRRRRRSRNALIGAGQKLFADRSVDGVSIDDITMAADVGKGTFYNHFEDKESLAETIVALVQGDCEQEVYAANLDRTDPAERVARAVGALVSYSRQHPDRYRAMVNLTRRRMDISAPINRGLRHDIEAGLASGDFHGFGVQAGVLAVFGMITGAIDRLAWSNSDEAAQVIGETGFMLLRSLGVPDGRALAASRASAEEFGTAPVPIGD